MKKNSFDNFCQLRLDMLSAKFCADRTRGYKVNKCAMCDMGVIGQNAFLMPPVVEVCQFLCLR